MRLGIEIQVYKRMTIETIKEHFSYTSHVKGIIIKNIYNSQ